MALTIINLILCVLIVALGVVSYRQNGSKLSLNIGAAFSFFGASHLLVLLGLEESMESFIIAIRVIAYILVVIALFTTLKLKDGKDL